MISQARPRVRLSHSACHRRAVRFFVDTGVVPNPELVMESEGSSNISLMTQSIADHIQAGEQAFERTARSWLENPNATELQRAEAIAEFGDWHLVFREINKPRKQYELAYRLLAGSGDTRFHPAVVNGRSSSVEGHVWKTRLLNADAPDISG